MMEDIIYYLVGFWYYEDYDIDYGDSGDRGDLMDTAISIFEKTFKDRYGMTYDEYVKNRKR